MTHTTDPLLAIDRSLTDDERAVFLARVATDWPGLVGAEPADVLELTTSHDMFLAHTEPFWEGLKGKLPDVPGATAALHALIILGADLTVENVTRMLTAAGLMPEPEAARVSEVRMAFDPLPALARLLSAASIGLGPAADRLLQPHYQELRDGLALPALVRPTEAERAIREALRGFITPAGKLITTEEIRDWVDEAERGYDLEELRNAPAWQNYDGARDALLAGKLSPDQADALLRDARNSPDPVVSLAHGVTVRCGSGTRWQVTWHDRPARPGTEDPEGT